jgi:hypothetical protein
MAVQKKKKVKKPKQVNEGKVFTWTPARKAAALMLSTGLKTQRQVCLELHITEKTMCEWKKFPAFIEEIDNLTLKNENFTRAGLLKACLKGMDMKKNLIPDDRSTYLDYVKMISDLQGLTKQKIELEGNMKHSGSINLHTLSDEELMEIIKNDT